MEACPSAHHWSRELQALGHRVRLMPPSYVKAYLKRSKNDANDAAAICQAVVRPSMRFVPIKTKEQQAGLMLHRTRQLLVRQRTMLSNARCSGQRHRIVPTYSLEGGMSALGHVWTAPWQELSDVAAALVGCGHVSGLFVRRIWPLALMLCADRVPIESTHFKVR